MTSLRRDKATGKWYTWFNLPIPCTNAIQTENGYYIILAESHYHPETQWYNDTFLGDRYAVFHWNTTTKECGFYQQVSPWYERFGNAVRKMLSLAKPYNLISEKDGD